MREAYDHVTPLLATARCLRRVVHAEVSCYVTGSEKAQLFLISSQISLFLLPFVLSEIASLFPSGPAQEGGLVSCGHN